MYTAEVAAQLLVDFKVGVEFLPVARDVRQHSGTG